MPNGRLCTDCRDQWTSVVGVVVNGVTYRVSRSDSKWVGLPMYWCQ